MQQGGTSGSQCAVKLAMARHPTPCTLGVTSAACIALSTSGSPAALLRERERSLTQATWPRACAPPPLFPPVLTGQASSLPSYLLDTIDPWERRGVAHLRVMSCERTAMARYAMPASRTFFGKDACNTLDRSEPSPGARDSSRRGPNAAVQHAGVSRRGRGGDLRRRQVPVHRDENLRTNQPSERDTTHRNRQTHRRGRRAWQGAAGAARAAAARRGVRAPGPLRPR